jgi:hypothetical protein
MNRLNASIAHIPLPKRMRWLPLSDTGYPVPWFVDRIDGKPDFRVMDGIKYRRALKADLCWLCGQTLGRFKCFVAGPMCAVNRTSAEPPNHRECAEYAAQACPFLTKPRMRRNDHDMPEHRGPGGVMLTRNPGCVLLWITHDYRVIYTDTGPVLQMGQPVEIIAYAEGRLATRAEVDASITSGLPLLSSIAEREGADAMQALADQVEHCNALFKAKLKVAQPQPMEGR